MSEQHMEIGEWRHTSTIFVCFQATFEKKTLCGGGMWRVSYPGKAQLKNPTFQPVTTAAILWELQVSTEVDKQRAPGDSI